MIQRQFILVGSISAIIGIMMGVLLSSWTWLGTSATFARTGALARTEAGIAAKVELLEHIRSGRYSDATQQLEAWLDHDLAGAGELASDGVALSARTLQAVGIERKARGLSGYEPTDATVSAKVQKVFRLLPESDSVAAPAPAVIREEMR